MEIDFDAWQRKEAAAGMVRGREYPEWHPEITSLKRAGRLDEALVLIYECIDATERADRIAGHGCPAPWYYEQAAMIHRKERNPEAEVAVLDRYLRAASSTPTARARVLDRYTKAWQRLHGTNDAPVPPAASPQGGLAQLLDRERADDRRNAESVARRFLAGPVLADDAAEAQRRSNAGLPSFLLNKTRWRRQALLLAGPSSDAAQIVDALLARSDRWGVLDPDQSLIDQTFSTEERATIDRRTGEVIRTPFSTTRVEMWLSAETGIDLRTVDQIVGRFSSRAYGMLAYWRIDGDIMDGKAELTELDDD